MILSLLLAVLVASDSIPRSAMVATGVISTEFNEFGGSETLDGDTLYFTRSVPRSYMYVILRSHRTATGWSEPEVAPFSGQWRDFDAVIPPNGEHMYFTSDRPIDGVRQTEYRFWGMDRTPTGWSQPHPLGPPFDRYGFAWALSESRDGTIYFDVQSDTGLARVYTTHRTATGYAEPHLLPSEVNLPGVDVREPCIAPDGSFLVFVSGPGDVQSFDLYVSDHRPDGGWTPARRLAELSSPTRDYSPRITPDGRWLYFTSEHGFADAPRVRSLTYDELEQRLRGTLNGLGNIYRVPIAVVHDTVSLVRQQIDSINAEYIRAYANADANAVVALYDTAASEMLDHGRVIHGRDALLAYWSDWNKRYGKIQLALAIQDFWPVGDRVYETGTYTTGYRTAAGKPASVSGHYATIWKRQADGGWKILAVFDTPK